MTELQQAFIDTMSAIRGRPDSVDLNYPDGNMVAYYGGKPVTVSGRELRMNADEMEQLVRARLFFADYYQPRRKRRGANRD